MASEENGKVTIDILPTIEQFSGGRVRKTQDASPAPGGSLQQTVDSAIAQVLGRNLKSADPKAFLATLNQTFVAKETNGKTDYTWVPRSYAVQTELGGKVTGAQASLYFRAKSALDSILPLLTSLTPLDPAADLQNMDAARSIIRTELVELVNELGIESGPRVWKVQNLFRLLLGDEFNGVGNGQFHNLKIIFGFQRDRINTVAEEQSYSNYLIILDSVISLKQSWTTYLEGSTEEAYLGTQLVKLSQAMAVVAESVNQVYEIMDCVFLGPAERQTIVLTFNEGQFPSITLQELLTWVMQFATEEGQTLAREGGKLAIAQVIKDTAETLSELVAIAAETNVNNSAYNRAGVRDSLRDLASQLSDIQALAEDINAPRLDFYTNDRRSLNPSEN